MEQPERRKDPRYLCLGHITLVRLPGISWTGRILDLSLGGCLIEIRSFVYAAPGSAVELTIQTGGAALRMMGKITFADKPAPGRIGISFTQLSKRGQRELARVIAELEAARASPEAQ